MDGNAMREYHKARYEYLTQNGRCVICTRRDERTLVGMRLCRACAEARAMRNLPMERQEKKRQQARERKHRLIEAGLCCRCGQRPPEDGYRTCRECRDREKDYQRQCRKKRRRRK